MDELFIIYDLNHSVRELQLNRARALSHAAKVQHIRRRGRKRITPLVAHELTVARCTCPQRCKSKAPSSASHCLRSQFLPSGGPMHAFQCLPIVMTNAVHEIIVFWFKPTLWDCEYTGFSSSDLCPSRDTGARVTEPSGHILILAHTDS